MAKKQNADESAATVAAESAPSSTEEVVLVKMVKDGEVLEVHPSCVDAHRAQRWTVAE